MAWTKEDRSFKTLVNRRTTDSTNKFWFNEFSDSTLNLHISEIWTDTIDSDPAQAVTDGVAEHKTLFVMTLDGTVPSNQCYYADDSGTRLKDWISTKYGDNYQVHLYDNNNAEIFTTDACQWFFDYQTGILTFNASVSSFTQPFKISAYRYIGSKGSGVSGTSGTSGSSGTSGIGADGSSGTSGSSGINGADGTSGTSGSSGVNGIDGTSGTSGAAGADGTSGTSGSSGINGVDGTSGTSGSSGINGTSGTSGSSGVNGVDGTSGTSGSSGINGVDGTSGTSGSKGADGTSGTSGSSGINGIDGTSGSSGISGADGTSGTSGSSGINGVDGTSGTSGVNGADGSSGTSGTSGVGVDGTSGTSGSSGINGVDGSSGTSGTSGVGVDGTSGTSGSSGINGIDGTSGTSGVNGADGTSGTSGINGVDGSSGTSGTSGTGVDGTSGTSGSSGVNGIDGSSGTSGTSGVGVDGTSGSSGTSGIDGTSGTSGTSGSNGVDGTSGSSGTSGSGDGTIPLGELPSGQTYDGLITLTETDQVNESINWLNEVLLAIAPAKPGMMTSQTLTLSGTTKYSAKIPSGLTSDWYGGGVSAGDTVTDYVVDNTFTLTSPSPTTSFYNGFDTAPGGTLQLYDSTTSIDSISTASTGSSTYLTVSDVSLYNSIWSKANAYAGITQSAEGYKSYSFHHTLAGNSNATAIRYDDVASTPSFSSTLSVALNTIQSKWLSGIEYYGQNTTLDISYTAASGIFQKAYHPTAVAVVSQNVGAFASFNQNPASTPAYTDTFAVSSYTVTLNVGSRTSNSPTITVTLQKPDGKTAASTANLAKGVCTYGTASTTTADYFYDEAQRLVIGTDTAWTSTSALTTGNAQVRNGYLQFPNSTEYPGFSGDQEYQRKFTKASASTGNLTFGNVTYTQISPYGTGDLNILLALDTDGQYFDLGRVVGDNNGTGDGTTRGNSKGARSSGSGSIVYWSIGTYSTADNSSQFRLIIIFKNTTRTITSIVSA